MGAGGLAGPPGLHRHLRGDLSRPGPADERRHRNPPLREERLLDAVGRSEPHRPRPLRADVGGARRGRHQTRLRTARHRRRVAARRPGGGGVGDGPPRRRLGHPDPKPPRGPARRPARGRPERGAPRRAVPPPVRPPGHRRRRRRRHPGGGRRRALHRHRRPAGDRPRTGRDPRLGDARCASPRLDPRALLELPDRFRPLGGDPLPSRGHHHQHPGEVRHHLDADDLRAADLPDTGASPTPGPDLAVARDAAAAPLGRASPSTRPRRTGGSSRATPPSTVCPPGRTSPTSPSAGTLGTSPCPGTGTSTISTRRRSSPRWRPRSNPATSSARRRTARPSPTSGRFPPLGRRSDPGGGDRHEPGGDDPPPDRLLAGAGPRRRRPPPLRRPAA